MSSLNPCTIDSVCDDLSHLFHLDRMDEQPRCGNAIRVPATYREAVRVLTDGGCADRVSRLTWFLKPVFGKGVPRLSDQKMGGTPDFRRWLYVERDRAGRFNTGEIWPRCGCCHQNMRFVGQFDLLPWLLPVHAATGKHQPAYPNQKMTEYTVYSAVGNFRMVEHAPIYRRAWWHFFACPDTAGHFDNPNYESTVLISHEYRDLTWDQEAPVAEDTTEAWRSSIPKVKRNSATMSIKPRKILGWDFRLALEEDLGDPSYEGDDRVADLMKSRPDLFGDSWGLKLFGPAVSQQFPRRYWALSGSEPRRMTPVLSFDDDSHDMTYQFYADTRGDGFELHAKVDASCT